MTRSITPTSLTVTAHPQVDHQLVAQRARLLVIAVDVALMGGLGRAWWLPLIGLGVSLLISVAAISQLLICLSFALGGIGQLLPSFWETVKHLAH